MKYFQSSTPLAIISLIAANLLPMGWVLSGEINPGNVFLLYWLETWIIAFYCLIKIRKAAAPITEREARVMRSQLFGGLAQKEVSRGSVRAIFILQFIVVMPICGALLFGVTTPLLSTIFSQEGDYLARVATAFPSQEAVPGFIISVLAFFVSHGISFMTNFIGRGEFLKISPVRQYLQFGKRVLAMLLFVFLGPMVGYMLFIILAIPALVLAAIGLIDMRILTDFVSQNALPLVGLMSIKLIVDLASHSHEHRIVELIGPQKPGMTDAISRPQGAGPSL